MPTIDQLAPASSASDADEFIVSQGGIARSITRAQILRGVQPQISVTTLSLLGRASTGTGSPEVIAIGRNLTLSAGTLIATAAPFTINTLPSGLVPAPGDLISLSQAGTNVAVSYAQLLSGFSGVANIDVSQAMVLPTGSNTSQSLAALTGKMLAIAGGSFTNTLLLVSAPSVPGQAANKAYVDQQMATALPLSGGSLTGALSLPGAPLQSLHAVTKNYVDTAMASALSISGGSLAGLLSLSADPVNGLHASSKRYTDLKLARSGDTLSGALLLAGDPTSALQASTKGYVDTQVGTSLGKAGGTLSGSLTLAFDPTSSSHASTKQYVDQRVLRTGDTLTGQLVLFSDPLAGNQAATKNYVDVQGAASVNRAGSSMTGSLLLSLDPALPLQASTKQYVDLRVARIGDTFSGPVFLAADPAGPMQAATKQYVDLQAAKSLTKSGASLTGPLILTGDPAVSLEAATKQYTDSRVLRSGDTLTGTLSLSADPLAPFHAATKNYVDIQLPVLMSKSGGTLTGNLVLSGDPVTPAQAATKRYVDAQALSTLQLSGGSLSGSISLSGLPTLPLHAAAKQYVDAQVSIALPVSGGSLTGALSLAGAPTSPSHAATKLYVDANPSSTGVINVTLPPYGAKLNGVADDTTAFKAAYQAASVGSAIYVPYGTTVLQQPGAWGIALTKRVKWLVDGTVLSDGTPLASCVPGGGGPAGFVLPGFIIGNTATGIVTSQGSSQPSDVAVHQSAYIVGHNGGAGVVANSRIDTIIYNSPGSFVWGGIDRLIWAGIQTPNIGAPAQHVGRYIQTLRSNVANGTNGLPLPQPQLWAACLEYRDQTGLRSSVTNAGLTVEMDWFGNGLDDGNNRTIQSLVIGQHNTAGPPVEISSIIGVWLAGGSTGSAKTVLQVTVPFSSSVIDTTNATSINNAPAIRMAAGQAIAFETTNSNRLVYDNATGTLRWYQGALSYPVGKGITVGWVSVYSASANIPNYTSGNIVFLIGSNPYTIGLPAANTVAAGVGFTFSVVGTGVVSIAPSGNDGIDLSPVTLRINDRYHVVSDGYNTWHEIFRCNSVAPRFLGPPVLPSYAVATLPTGMPAGAHAFVTNGRKPTDAVGAGGGVEVFFDGIHWISCCSGTTVSA